MAGAALHGELWPSGAQRRPQPGITIDHGKHRYSNPPLDHGPQHLAPRSFALLAGMRMSNTSRRLSAHTWLMSRCYTENLTG
jgi:hypothetical protein